jgi:hypothetical protein
MTGQYMGKIRNSYNILISKSEGKNLGRQMHRLEDNNKTDA